MGWMEEGLRSQILDELDRCTECRKCINACPLPESKDIDIEELNHATRDTADARMLEFAFDCFGCGACVPVCPEDLRRDLMMLWIRATGRLPKGYDNLLHWRGQELSPIENIAYSLLKITKKKVTGALGKYVDNSDFNQADNLFYFGCYIFSPSGTCHSTLAIADYLDMDYEVMAGYKYCCGYPHYHTGRLGMGEKLYADLYNAIKKVNPKVVITGCTECYAALKKIKHVFNADFEPITTTEWILRNLEKFELSKHDEKITIHDGCQLSRLEDMSENPRQVISKVFDIVEMPDSRENTLCCGGMRAAHNPQGLLELREKKLIDAKNTGAEKMVTECITCWEKYQPLADKYGIEVVDIIDIVKRFI